jgi:glucose-1-phosphate thymidylyltransferase
VTKAILLAGGRGTRLFPLTAATNKHLLPVHDKPMIFYPLSTLMLLGVREVLVVSGTADLPAFERLLGDGAHLGIRIQYAPQDAPRGIAEAFLIAEPFLAGEGGVLALGDNFFWGRLDSFRTAMAARRGATIFAYPVQEPTRYGVVTLDGSGQAVHIAEKPERPRSDLAIPGMYFFDERATAFAKALAPSSRGELEITDVLRRYLDAGELSVIPLGRGMAWLDMGTSQSLLEASAFVAAIERRQGLRIGCLEECALRMGFRTRDELRVALERYPQCEYTDYIRGLLDA